MSDEALSAIQRKLDETISKIKAAKDQEVRHQLFEEMRRLVAELEQIITESSKVA
jgi:low affinity Fe/Cu permease